METPLTAREIMAVFARSTGLTDHSVAPRRYLWTDAFAVCNFLALYRQSGDYDDLQHALQLVDQVHQTLGRHHQDSEKEGWISGLPDKEAQRHPTVSGLRIGKQLNERPPGELFDEQLEWERDGQYFHYLTKWMHALCRVAQVTGRSVYQVWALELAKTAHAAFTDASSAGGHKQMYWKMSIDLSRPLVPSMGQHDPLDGLITYLQLETTATQFNDIPEKLDLSSAIRDMVAMCEGQHWATQDALGIGGLLTDACRLMQMIALLQVREPPLLPLILGDIETSLRAFSVHQQLNLPAEYRLAFRELGLSIGLNAVGSMKKTVENHASKFSRPEQIKQILGKLEHYQPLREFIETYWLKPAHRQVNCWREHADINNVMLATSLAPDGFLTIA